ncbi:hypothetical protein D4R52_00440, partial [bacterium]
MRGIEGFSERGAESPARTETLERRNKFLSRVNEIARKLVIFGVLGGTAASTEVELDFFASQAAETGSEKKLSFQEKKEKAEEMFGRSNAEEAKSYEIWHPEEMPQAKTSVKEFSGNSSGETERLGEKNLAEILSKTYPKGWVDNEVYAITGESFFEGQMNNE